MIKTSIFCFVLLGLCGGASAVELGTSLLVNGNAEAGNTSGWISTGGDAFPTTGPAPGTLGLPAGTSLGNYVFTGGTGPASGQSLSQRVDVSELGSAIDSGALSSTFSVLVQSREFDPASGELRFLDASNTRLATFAFADTPSTTYDWALFQDNRVVPAGTRSIEVYLLSTRTTGVSSDGYFDNASLTLTSAVPEPAAALLVVLGLSLLAGQVRRQCSRATGPLRVPAQQASAQLGDCVEACMTDWMRTRV